MNLRDQLKEILPDILPRNPAQSIKGTELIEMVKHQLKQEYSDATLRYHFSIMSCDPSSPIAKVEQGQGYFLRSTSIHSLNSARNLIREGLVNENGTALEPGEIELAITRASKFRALVQRYLEFSQQYPFAFEESFSEDPWANRWRVPDLAVIDWLAVDAEEGGLSKQKLEVNRRIGASPMKITSVKLRLRLDYDTVLEDLFQCLSASEWANAGELIIAEPIKDARLSAEVSRFAARHGIGVLSFGLDADALDDLPEPAVIENFTHKEFASILGHFISIRRYAAPITDRDHDWQHVVTSANTNSDFSRFEAWVSHCLMEEHNFTYREFETQDRGGSTPEREHHVA